MTIAPMKVTKHGEEVWVHPKMDDLRKTECLCFSCSNYNPETTDHCHVAQLLYGICVDFNLAMMITRCREFEDK